MSDHIDGPRTTADPSVDLTDLFAFNVPANPRRTVLIADVFPFAGESALFSNVVNYAIAVRPVRMTGTGRAAAFKAQEPESRFVFEFEVLTPSPDGRRRQQTGVCSLPDGRRLAVVVGDEQGASTPDGTVRVFVGLRSDPFFIGWSLGRILTKLPNFLEEDNCLSLVVEFDTASILGTENGSLFGVVAETTPRQQSNQLLPPRFDWVGRPEQTNFRLNGLPDAPDIRDLWNQQKPFAVTDALVPVFRERLTQSFQYWDMRDGKVEWEDAALAANVNVFLDDFLLIDVSKPISDTSHLEIEKSTVEGRPYATGGGRTVNANVIDILVTWLVNRDRGPLMESATKATKPGGVQFPYVQPPNTSLMTISQGTSLGSSAQAVWAVVGKFDGLWHPLMATIETTGTGTGQLRRSATIDGKVIVERLTLLNEATRTLRYTLVSGIPATRYEGTITVMPEGQGSHFTWTVAYRPDGQGELIVHAIVSTLLGAGVDTLKSRFGEPR